MAETIEPLAQLDSEREDMDYFVSWEIEVKAENPVEAAKLARAAQTLPGTRSTVFQVFGEGAQDAVRVDLSASFEESGT
ncbi:MAG TPA: hypothetical protein VGT08_11580 [Terracidiphilus sp.]|nr:hypothetical protein [Terracidiphilus sp.]